MNRTECPRSGRGRGLPFLLLSLALALGLAACSNPEKAKAEHLQRAQQYLKEKKYQEAALEFRNALQLDERLADAHYGLAQAYEAQENFLPAIQELRRTLELKPDHPDAAVRLGNYYLLAFQANPNGNKEHREQAWRLTKEVLERHPDFIEGHILKASLLYTDGKRDEALAALPAELIDKLSLIGPKEKIRDDLAAWRETIVTTLLVSGDANTLRTAAELVLA